MSGQETKGAKCEKGQSGGSPHNRQSILAVRCDTKLALRNPFPCHRCFRAQSFRPGRFAFISFEDLRQTGRFRMGQSGSSALPFSPER